MLLSEAILIGSTFRGEARNGPFVRVANTDELRSDVWGAACEAVHSPIAKRNWNKANQLEYNADIEALRDIQQKHFPEYFRMPANCPGATARQVVHAGGRLTGRKVQGLNEFAIEKEVGKDLPGVTSACQHILSLAEFIEHAFYVHNWTREMCAEAAEHFEQGSAISVVQNFDHYQDLSVQQRVNHKLTVAARQRERQRRSRRSLVFH